MGEKLNKVKTHFKENWERYAVAVISVAFITYVIVKDRSNATPDNIGVDGQEAATILPLSDAKIPYGSHRTMKRSPTDHIVFNVSNGIGINNGIVNVVEREGRGHPGYMVRCLETGLTYNSQKSAANAMNVSRTHMSDHLNGRLNDVGGFHFERIYLA